MPSRNLLRMLWEALTSKRSACFAHMPLLDYRLSTVATTVLTWLAVRAHKRGDLHEFQHTALSAAVGDSSHDAESCALGRDVMSRSDLSRFKLKIVELGADAVR